MHEVILKAKDSGLRASVVDLDGTGYKDSFAKSIGYGFLKREAKAWHVKNFLRGLKGAMKINLRHADDNGYQGENSKGLEMLFDVLGKTGCADRNYAYFLAHQHRKGKALQGFEGFLKDLRALGPVFIATDECDIAPDVVSDSVQIDGWIANPVIYRYRSYELSSEPIVFSSNGKIEGKPVFNENPMISGCIVETRDAEDKKKRIQKLLDKAKLDLSEVIAIGDSKSDLPYLEDAGISVSSPLAKKEVIRKTDYQIISYLD